MDRVNYEFNMNRESGKSLLQKQMTNLNSALDCLLSCKFDRVFNKEKIDFFFDSLIDLPLDFKKISYIGKTYRAELERFRDIDKDTHEFFSIALEGIANAKFEIKNMERKFQDVEIQKEYTNMTSSGKVLILDDDVFMLNILNRLFEMNGYEVIISSNPLEVSDIIRDGNIDIALIDLIMPEVDGFEVMKIIKAEIPELPVVFVSANDDIDIKVDALKCGAEDYIVKPFKTEEVLARVEGILKRSYEYNFNVNIDELTGAYTRKHFANRINKYLHDVKAGQSRTLSLVDLDKFKEINDTYGHLAGDEILARFIEMSKSFLSFSEIFRFGGDEFLIVCEDKTEKETKAFLESFRKHINRIENPISGINETIKLSISIGVTDIKSGDYISSILDRADKALYTAKESGRNRLVAYSDIKENSEDNQKNILIVDGENAVSNLVKNRLKSLGYGVELSNGILDIGEMLQKDLDLIIIDLEAYNKSKKDLEKHGLTMKNIILIISEQDKKSLKPSDIFNIEEIIVKPISVLEVEKKVRRILSQSISD